MWTRFSGLERPGHRERELTPETHHMPVRSAGNAIPKRDATHLRLTEIAEIMQQLDRSIVETNASISSTADYELLCALRQ